MKRQRAKVRISIIRATNNEKKERYLEVLRIPGLSFSKCNLYCFLAASRHSISMPFQVPGLRNGPYVIGYTPFAAFGN